MGDDLFLPGEHFDPAGKCFKASCATYADLDDKFESTLFLPARADRKGEGGLRAQGIFKRSQEKKPLVSIVTVVYNGAKHLELTIGSVAGQRYENIEYIVIDGGSTDGTLDILHRYDGSIDYWVSEPDSGIYDAMNKGLKVAAGSYIMFLNADDALCEEAVLSLLKRVNESGRDYCVGAVKTVPSNIVVEPVYPLEAGRVYFGMPYPHVGAIIPLSVYKKVGLFETSYRICADYDMAMRIHLSGYRASKADGVVARIMEGGVSSSWRTKKENLDIAVSCGMPKKEAYVRFLKSVLKEIAARVLPMSVKKALWKSKKSRYRYEK